MTGTLTMRLSFMLVLLTMGCSSGPMGGPTSYNVPPTRTGAPQYQAPIATQPTMSPTTTSVRVLPFATLPPHASMQAQNGGVRPLAMLASNDQYVDGRPVTSSVAGDRRRETSQTHNEYLSVICGFLAKRSLSEWLASVTERRFTVSGWTDNSKFDLGQCVCRRPGGLA
jgi:hypothetical protein